MVYLSNAESIRAGGDESVAGGSPSITCRKRRSVGDQRKTVPAAVHAQRGGGAGSAAAVRRHTAAGLSRSNGGEVFGVAAGPPCTKASIAGRAAALH